MSLDTIHGIGALKKNVVGIPPTAPAAGTVTGANFTTGVDRTGFTSVEVEVVVGAVTGAPSTQTLDVKIQHSDTVGGAYTDWVPVTGVAASGAVAQITTVSTRKKKTIDLKGAKACIRVSALTAFTGGSSPTLFQAVNLSLAGADTLPAQADD